MAALMLLAGAGSILLAQPTVQIVSPADGAVVNPGQALTVTVQASGTSFHLVGVLGDGCFGSDQSLTTTPYVFTIQIPPQISPGLYSLTALGAPAKGDPVYSKTIFVDVERSDTAVGISADTPTLLLEAGVRTILSATATYADGTTSDIARSTQTTYTSDTPTVVTASGHRVTAVGPGTGNITIAYGGKSARVSVTVPQPVTVVPTAVALNPSMSQQFYGDTALPPGTDFTVTWSLHPELGSIDDTGLYTAPSSVDSLARVVVTATSVARPTESGSAEVQLLPPVSVSVSPPLATLTAGSKQHFSATLTNSVDRTVIWSVIPPGTGILDRRGNYTAPATITTPRTVTIKATSEADKNATGSAQVKLVPSR
ncbi:MAG TPA: Ig-like domain-containing protein [Bryobacteraceae bacterium]